MASWFSSRSLTMLTLCLVDGYSFANILKIFKLAGVPIDIITKYDKYPRCGKTQLVEETLSSIAGLRDAEANTIIREIVEEVMTGSHGPQYPQNTDYIKATTKLQRFLMLDGFNISQGQLVRSVPEEVVKEENILEGELTRLGFDLVKHHLTTSFEHFGDGQWDSANGQTRKALEALTELIAMKIASKKGESIPRKYKDPRPAEIRKYLKDVGFLNDAEFDLLSAFYGYASVEGGHPGLSSETDARIRRIIVVGLCQFYVEKFHSFA